MRGIARGRRLGPTLAVFLITGVGFWASRRPVWSGREWIPGHAVLPEATFSDDRVRVTGVRDFEYRSLTDFSPRYGEREFDLNEIESVWYVVVPFSTDWRGPAHTFLSFGFADSTYVSVSVEARREPGETYSMMAGVLHRFEVIYVVGEERDLIGARALLAEDDVYVYPIRADQESVRQLFTEMLERANRLRETPEFYNTLFNNCTTSILDHVNAVRDEKIRYGPRILLPGYSDRIAHRRGLIDTDLDLAGARARFRVNDRVRRWAAAPDFSVRIRRDQ